MPHIDARHLGGRPLRGYRPSATTPRCYLYLPDADRLPATEQRALREARVEEQTARVQAELSVEMRRATAAAARARESTKRGKR